MIIDPTQLGVSVEERELFLSLVARAELTNNNRQGVFSGVRTWSIDTVQSWPQVEVRCSLTNVVAYIPLPVDLDVRGEAPDMVKIHRAIDVVILEGLLDHIVQRKLALKRPVPPRPLDHGPLKAKPVIIPYTRLVLSGFVLFKGVHQLAKEAFIQAGIPNNWFDPEDHTTFAVRVDALRYHMQLETDPHHPIEFIRFVSTYTADNFRVAIPTDVSWTTSPQDQLTLRLEQLDYLIKTAYHRAEGNTGTSAIVGGMRLREENT
jgi:hypothetical protein